MDIHENARTTPRSRMLIVERLEAGSTVAAVASAFGVDGRTVRKWRDRFRVEGAAGLGDRSSRPHSCPFRLDAAAETEIAVLRRQRLSGPAIARRLGRPVSTVGKALRRIGLGRLKALDPAVAVVRDEREQPGGLIHIDSKKLGRIDGIGHRITGDRRGQSSRRGRGEGLGWEALHVAIDDASRLAYTEILPDEKTSATAFLERALGFFAPWHQGRARHDRQRLGLQKLALSKGTRKSRHPPQANQAIHATHQRQGRTLHPDIPARMALRPTLPELGPANRSYAGMAVRLQHPQTSCRPRRQASHLKTQGQRPWKRQLEHQR